MRTKSKSILSLCGFLAIAIGTAASASIATVIQPPIHDSFSLDQEHHWVLIRNKDKKEFLFRTDDGGTHWTSSAAPFNIWKLFFADASEGWGIAAEQRGESFDKFCIHTSDSGLTWQRLGAIAHGRETPTGIAFDTGEHGWVVGEGVEEGASGAAFVMETNDGGIHWTKLKWKTQPASGLYGVLLSNRRVLTWSAGSGGSGIYELRTGAPPRKISDRETMDLASYTNGPLYALSWSGVYQQTADSNEWEETFQAAEAGFRSLSFADSQRGCAAGNEMYCTHDGGRTWTHLGLPKSGHGHDTVHIFRLCMIGEDSVWAVSEDQVYEISEGASKWTRVEFFDKSGRPLESFRRE
jgi:photosystem II stability/assembly factor-like uncharacterized protein